MVKNITNLCKYDVGAKYICKCFRIEIWDEDTDTLLFVCFAEEKIALCSEFYDSFFGVVFPFTA